MKQKTKRCRLSVTSLLFLAICFGAALWGTTKYYLPASLKTKAKTKTDSISRYATELLQRPRSIPSPKHLDPRLIANLNNGHHIPLVGASVAGLHHEEVLNQIIHSNVGSEKKIRLLDTSQELRNEHLIASSIQQLEEENKSGRTRGGAAAVLREEDFHVLTKLHHTHLGYERTALAVRESVEDFKYLPHIHLHVMLHGTKSCLGAEKRRKCEQDEQNLPQYVKDVGSAPYLKQDAWKESWRAMEDMYMKSLKEADDAESGTSTTTTTTSGPMITSISVADLSLDELTTLLAECRVKPAIYQGSIETYHSPDFQTLFREHDILFQADDLQQNALKNRRQVPRSVQILEKIGQNLQKRHSALSRSGSGSGSTTPEALVPLQSVTAPMVAMAYLTQEKVALVHPPALSRIRLLEQSPDYIASVPPLTDEEKVEVKRAIVSLVRGTENSIAEDRDTQRAEVQETPKQETPKEEDEEPTMVEARFFNHMPHPVQIFWHNQNSKEEHLVIRDLQPKDTKAIEAHRGHLFIVYDMSKTFRHEFLVPTAHLGHTAEFEIQSDVDTLVTSTFFNNSSKRILVYWFNEEKNEKMIVIDDIRPGMSSAIEVHRGHKFIVHDMNDIFMMDFIVGTEHDGNAVEFYVKDAEVKEPEPEPTTNRFIKVEFENLRNKDIQVVWFKEETNEERAVIRSLAPNRFDGFEGIRGQKFIAYDMDKQFRQEFVIPTTQQGDVIRFQVKEETRLIQATFFNSLSRPVQVFWLNGQTKEEKHVIADLASSQSSTIEAHLEHTFVAYDMDKKFRQEFIVPPKYGDGAIDFQIKEKTRLVQANFANSLSSPVNVYWYNEVSNEERMVISNLEAGKSKSIDAHLGHKFIVSDDDKNYRKEFVVPTTHEGNTVVFQVAEDRLVQANFFNALPNSVQVFWIDERTKEEKHVITDLPKGKSKMIEAHLEHKFVVYDMSKNFRQEFVVPNSYPQSGKVEFHVKVDTVSEKDSPARANFINSSSEPVRIAWRNQKNGEERTVIRALSPNDSTDLSVHYGHQFIAYGRDSGEFLAEFLISASHGNTEDLFIHNKDASPPSAPNHSAIDDADADNTKAEIHFVNSFSKPVRVFWFNEKTKEEREVIGGLQPGGSKNLQTHRGHRFVAYDMDREFREEFVVTASRGDTENFYISNGHSYEL